MAVAGVLPARLVWLEQCVLQTIRFWIRVTVKVGSWNILISSLKPEADKLVRVRFSVGWCSAW